MGMSTHVVGVVPADKKFQEMQDLWHRCKNMGFTPPKEVVEFFNGETPDDEGVVVEIPFEEYHADMESGLEVDLRKLPEKVKIIRFFNSY